MKLPFSHRLVVACIALFSMLFMQFAVASCACAATGNDSNTTFMSAPVEHVAMAGCEGMDMEQPSLCHTHAFGDATKQSLDKYELPQVQPFVPVGFVLALPVIDAIAGSENAPHRSVLLTRTTAPPLAIQHCCFRI